VVDVSPPLVGAAPQRRTGRSLTPPPGSVPELGESVTYTATADSYQPPGKFPSRDENAVDARRAAAGVRPDRDRCGGRNGVTEAILADFGSVPAHSGVVVDSPPGAGKSDLVVRASRALVAGGERLMVWRRPTSRSTTSFDRLAGEDPAITIGRLSAAGYVPPSASRSTSRCWSAEPSGPVDPFGHDRTAAKWATVTEGVWTGRSSTRPTQMRSDMLLRVAGRFDRASSSATRGSWTRSPWSRWSGGPACPGTRCRAPCPCCCAQPRPDGASPPGLVAAAGDRRAGGVQGVLPVHRLHLRDFSGRPRLEFSATGFRSPLDPVLGDGPVGGLGALRAAVPAHRAHRPRCRAAIAAIVERLLQRRPSLLGAVARRRAGDRRRIAVGAAHRDQVAAIRQALGGTAGADVTVDTANRLQGREYDITVVLHPLSGRRTRARSTGGRSPVRAGVPAPPRLRRGGPGGDRRAAGRAPVGGAGAPQRPGQFPGRLGGNQAMLAHLGAGPVPSRA